MSTPSSFSSSSSSSSRRCQPFDELFRDFPLPIRDKLIVSSKEIVKEYLAKTISKIRGLSRIPLGGQRERSIFMEHFDRLIGKLHVDEVAGVDVEEYRERLNRLKWVVHIYEEGLEHASDLRRKKQRLMLEVEQLQQQEVECRSGLEEYQIWFQNWSNFPWKKEPIQKSEEVEENVNDPSLEYPEAQAEAERSEEPKENKEAVEEEEDDNEDIENSYGVGAYDPKDNY